MVCAALIALARIGGTAADADILLLNVLNPDADIYLVDAGRALTAALTRGGDFDGHAIWSPDGNAIAFDSNRGADWDIYTMTAFGADVRPVTTGSEPAASFSPVWSPDGTQIAHFQRLQGQSYAALFVTARDGSHTQRLSDYYIMSVQRPTWTADGAQIVFAALHGDARTESVPVADVTLHITSGPSSPHIMVAPLHPRTCESSTYAIPLSASMYILSALSASNRRPSGTSTRSAR